MTIEIKVPQLPESVSDATIALWVKKVGDQSMLKIIYWNSKRIKWC